MSCPSLHKKATFHCDQESDKKLYESAVQSDLLIFMQWILKLLIDPADVEGNLIIKDIKKIDEAKVVKWTPRDLVFYPDTEAKALSGFVCPVDFARHFTDTYLLVLW
jgi:hypothetical protein